MRSLANLLRWQTVRLAVWCVLGLIGGLDWWMAQALAGEDGPDWLPETVFAPVLGGDRQQGYILRADTWEGELPLGETKPIRHQFIKGNDYHFYVSTSVPGAAVSLHIYDQDGNLVESRTWNKEDKGVYFAGADVHPATTGTYYLILKVDKSPQARTAWDMAYAYK